MNIELDLLDNVRIASPCSAEWDEMHGDDRIRHCDQCDKNVYNIAEMARAKAIDLLTAGGTAPCFRIYRRKDGKVLTSDCPIGLRMRIRARRWVAAIAGLVGISMSTSTGCIQVYVGGIVADPIDERTPAADRDLGEPNSHGPQVSEKKMMIDMSQPATRPEDDSPRD